jgi:hypothetical protein
MKGKAMSNAPRVLRKSHIGGVEVSTIEMYGNSDHAIAETMIFLDAGPVPGLVDQSYVRGPASGWLQQHQAMVEKVSSALYGHSDS